MTNTSLIQPILYFAVLLLLVKPLGNYMARVYEGQPTILAHLLSPVEKGIYRFMGIQPDEEMNWQTYASALLLLHVLGLLAVYFAQRLQALLPFNPQQFAAITPALAWNTAVSFVTNTNWQSYSGENTLSHFSQTVFLTVQNFLSAATGMAVLVALVRGFTRQSVSTIGNFWQDCVRSVLYILLPLSVLLALALVSQGVVQTIQGAVTVSVLEKDNPTPQQNIPLGLVASQVAIKQLGTNGGGYYNTNSAHPLENPTPLSNFLEMLAILLLPASLCYTFGKMVGDTRQGWAILAVMSLILVAFFLPTFWAEQQGNPALTALGVAGGNMEGKETRFGVVNSALWAVVTTAASNGSINSMHDSFMPLGGFFPLLLMQLGEVVFGGVGSGLYGMLVFAILAVFVAGLMVGRTPEYLGKKIEAYEMKMASLIILLPSATVLIGTAVALLLPAGQTAVFNPGPHGFSEVLYAFSSAGNNNGSAFAGLGANTLFYNTALGIAMFIARFWLIIPTLALAGSLAQKKQTPVSAGTLPTHTPLFVALLMGLVLIVGALTYIPSLALGPIVEHLLLP